MTAEIVFNLLLGLGIILYLLKAQQLPQSDNANDVLGAGGFPVILGILGLLVLVLITIRVVKEKNKISIPMFDLHTLEGRMLLTNVFLLGGYVGVLDFLGFAVSMALYLFAAAASIGYRKWLQLSVFSTATAAVMTFVFGALFFVPLPRGVEFFRELSYLVY